jgi:hypothetical protein
MGIRGTLSRRQSEVVKLDDLKEEFAFAALVRKLIFGKRE